MALQGAVGDLSDFLQFLVHAGKTGILQVSDDADTKFLAFENGQLCYGIHQRRIPDLNEILGPVAAPRSSSGTKDRWEEVVSRALERRRHLSVERLRIARMAEENLTQDQARECLSEIRAQQGAAQPTFRLGEYLVATGQITQRNLERALEEQIRGSKRLGEILIDMKVLTVEQVQGAAEELQALRGAFSHLYPLQQHLATTVGLDAGEFAAAASEIETTGRYLWDILVRSGKVTEEQMRTAVQAVLIDELCDLLTWPGTTFQFFENLFLDNVMVAEGFPMVHNGSFDLQSLLLRAHSHLDVLKQQGLESVTMSSIFAVDDATQGVTDDFEMLMNLDGRRPLREIRRALPGNRFSHCREFLQFVNNGQIRPISREVAFQRGQEAEESQEFGAALAFYKHALKADGHEPSNTRLRGVIQLVKDRVPEPGTGVFQVGLGSRSYASTGFFSRVAFFFEQVLIRTGCARLLWMLWRNSVRPLSERLEPLLHHKGARLAASTIVLASVIGCAMWVRDALEDISVANAAAHSVADNSGGERYAEQRYIIGVPIEVRPAATSNQILISARDGVLRSVHVPTTSTINQTVASRYNWECRVGEFGDLLSSALIDNDSVYVANVRGTATALSTQGDIKWQRDFPRLETFAPLPIHDQESTLVGVVVVSRPSVHVLSPADGVTMFEIATGNRITARPTVSESCVFVASADRHIYAADWRRGDYIWEHQTVSEDVLFLEYVGDRLVFATEGGEVSALDGQSGTVLWSTEFAPGTIHGITELAASQIAVHCDGGILEVLSVASGERVKTISPEPDLNAMTTRIWEGRFFYTSVEGHVGEIDSVGRPLWRSMDSVGHSTGSAFGQSFLGITTEEGELSLFRFQSNDSGLQP